MNDAIRRRSDAEIVRRLEEAPPDAIEQRLKAVGGEWDVERLLHVNAPVIVLLAWRWRAR